MPGITSTNHLTGPIACWPADILLQLLDVLAAPGACLKELYVVPEYRRQIYAGLFVEAMATAAKAGDCVKMDWLCLGDMREP